MTYPIRYKLTSQDMTTYRGFAVPPSGWYYPADLINPPLPCTSTVLHGYTHPLLAVLLNPIHANIQNPRLFKIQIKKQLGSDGLKMWSREQRIVTELDLPCVSTVSKLAFAILCAKEVYKDPSWTIWADNWLKNIDRTYAAAAKAANANAYAANAAAKAANANAANVAANVAAAAVAANVAYAAANAAATYAATAAAYAAAKEIDFLHLAKQAIRIN